jgi:aldehyde:ferredoxin oxidoreductase
MDTGGYMGKLLHVDLTRSDLSHEQPGETLLRQFIGGYGLGARIVYERMPAGADPLGPDNILGLVTGPLTGTPALIGSRYCAVGKSPLTGGWGDANSGGSFGPVLKFAGYDAVFVHGAADAPLYLLIENGRAELRPAADLWGMDAVDTEDALQERHGTDTAVACIGQAGERLSRIACIINDRGRAAGRSGLGAVMGAKRLKAIAVRGSQKPAVAHPERVKSLRANYLPLFQSNPDGQIMRQYGTPGYFADLVEIGRTPIKNWAGAYPADYPTPEAMDGPAVKPYEVRKYTCWRCPQACGAIIRWQAGDHTYEGHMPEYESLAALGSYCQIDDLEAVMTMNEMCNRAGLDTISAGAAISFAMECYEKNLLDRDALDGSTLGWGDGAAATRLLQCIIDREGLGNVLAEGVARAAHTLGRDAEALAMHAGGQELPAHDPRHFPDIGFAYEVSPTPGRHTQGGAGATARPPETQILYGLNPDEEATNPTRYHARAYAAVNGWKNVLNAAGLCSNGASIMNPLHVPEFMAAVTGWDFDMAECVETGERIEVMRLLLGLREGYNPLHTRLPLRAGGNPPLETGPTAGITVDLDELRAAYLEHMEWDPVTAMPAASQIKRLELADIVKAKGE